MLLTIGRGSQVDDVVDLLLECHERIRRFAALARRLASAERAPDAHIAAAAAMIQRYFAQSLPLHVADEEEAIAPLLAGGGADVDAALAGMIGDHAAQQPAIERLIVVCAAIAHDPRQLGALAAELRALTADLEVHFAAHLALEERVIFPALRALPDADRSALRDALRARREHAFLATPRAAH